MDRYLAAALLLLPTLGAQSRPMDLACITTIGEITYPPYEWGAGNGRRVRAEIQLNSEARPESIQAFGESAFAREAKRSALASTFDTRCQGRKLVVTYLFQLAGEQSETRDVDVRKEAIQVVVSAPPAVRRCSAEATNEDEAEANVGRGDRLLDERKLNEALQCAEGALLRKPIEGAYIVKGIALRKLGHVAEAIAVYNELERLNPSHHEVHFNRANAYRDLGDLEAAIRDYTTALGLMDSPEKGYVNRGNVYLTLKRFELARNDYQKAAELDPAESNAQNNPG